MRQGTAPEVSNDDIERAAAQRGIKTEAVVRPGITDPRMQNIAVLSAVSRKGLVPGVRAEHYEQAMDDLLKGAALEANLQLFRNA